jgi:hypothetical protein
VTADLRRMLAIHNSGESCHDERQYLIEVFTKDVPDAGPLETNTIHIVVRNVDQLLQAESAGLLRHTRRGYFLPRDIAKRSDEVDDGRLGPTRSVFRLRALYINSHP